VSRTWPRQSREAVREFVPGPPRCVQPAGCGTGFGQARPTLLDDSVDPPLEPLDADCKIGDLAPQLVR
jgi:hypothetical protein